jgi:hypothetical protein
VERILDDPVPEALMRRTLDQVKQQRPTVARTSKRPIERILLIAVTLAACVFGVALWMKFEPRGNDPAEIAEEPTLPRSTEVASESAVEWSSRPTMWAYNQAFRENPESLDDLLDAHAARLGNTDPESLRMGISLLYN